MDTRDAEEAVRIRELIDRVLAGMNTCIPGTIESFDDATQTVSVQPAIQKRTVIDGQESFLDPPKLTNVPLVFNFGATAGFALTFPVNAGDPCLIFFAQRAIDNWHDHGGLQPPEEASGSRHHSMTDAFVILAPSPIPDVLGSWESSGIEIRNRAHDSMVTVKDDAVVVTHKTASITLNAAGIALDGGAGTPGGVVQAACVCALTGKPHPMVSGTVKASL